MYILNFETISIMIPENILQMLSAKWPVARHKKNHCDDFTS